MSDPKIAIGLSAAPSDAGMYVLYVPRSMDITEELLTDLAAAWAAVQAGNRVLVLPEEMRLEWVGPGPAPEETVSE